MTGSRFLAYVPQIDSLLAGMHYEMALSEELTFDNELAQYPLEDPQQSSLVDHFQEQPLEISLSITVSTEMLTTSLSRRTNADGTAYNPFVTTPPVASGEDIVVTAAPRQRGTSRLQGMLEWIEKTRRLQSVSTDHFLTVHTGLRIYKNMAIQSCRVTREPEEPNTMTVDLTLIEIRLAIPPYRAIGKEWKMQGNHGPRSTQNTVLVEDIDRPIVEGMRFGSRIRSTQAAISDATRSDKLSRTKVAFLRLAIPQIGSLTLMPDSVITARLERQIF